MRAYRKFDRLFSPLWPRFRADQRGVVSILGAFAIILGLGISVIVIDVGHFYLAKRRLQSAVDAAALAAVTAATEPMEATRIAGNVLAQNGYETARLTVEPGHYTPDRTLSLSARLDTNSGSGQRNAVRITKIISTPGFFASVFHISALSDIQATATAAQTPIVSFSAGSGLAELNAGDLNAILGGLLGTNLTLDIASYRGLANANVSALELFGQLASQAGISVGNYDDLAATDIDLAKFIAAAKATVTASPQSGNAAALTALNLLSLQVPSGVTTSLNKVIDFSLWKTRGIGSILQQDQGATTINLFDVISAMARVHGAGVPIDLALALQPSLGGLAITNAQASLSLIQPMASNAVATVGDSVSTAQVRLSLNVSAQIDLLGLVTAHIGLPLYIEMASGRATVSAIPCHTSGTMTTISVQPQIVSLQLGNPAPAQMADFSHTVQISQQPNIWLAALGGTVKMATVQLSQMQPVANSQTASPLDFTQNDINTSAVHSAGSSAESLFATLANSTSLHISLLPDTLLGTVLNPLLGSLSGLVQGQVSNLLAALAPVVDTLLKTLGLQLGTMDVIVHGVSCSRPTLVG